MSTATRTRQHKHNKINNIRSQMIPRATHSAAVRLVESTSSPVRQAAATQLASRNARARADPTKEVADRRVVCWSGREVYLYLFSFILLCVRSICLVASFTCPFIRLPMYKYLTLPFRKPNLIMSASRRPLSYTRSLTWRYVRQVNLLPHSLADNDHALMVMVAGAIWRCNQLI